MLSAVKPSDSGSLCVSDMCFVDAASANLRKGLYVHVVLSDNRFGDFLGQVFVWRCTASGSMSSDCLNIVVQTCVA